MFTTMQKEITHTSKTTKFETASRIESLKDPMRLIMSQQFGCQKAKAFSAKRKALMTTLMLTSKLFSFDEPSHAQKTPIMPANIFWQSKYLKKLKKTLILEFFWSHTYFALGFMAARNMHFKKLLTNY